MHATQPSRDFTWRRQMLKTEKVRTEHGHGNGVKVTIITNW